EDGIRDKLVTGVQTCALPISRAILAGGGVRGGITFGSSDKLGAYPDTDAVSPADLAATVFWRLGLDPSREMIDLTGRPYRLADRSEERRVGKGCRWRGER